MTALGNETQSFVVLKLIQADGAFQGTSPNFKALDGGVDECGEGADDFGVEAAGVAPAVPDWQIVGPSESSLCTLTRVDGNEAQGEEDDNEDDQNDGHGFIETDLGQ